MEPICLPNHSEDFEAGTMCWISGWGATEEEGEFLSVCPLWCTHTHTHRQTVVWVPRGDQRASTLCHGSTALHKDLQPAGGLPRPHLLLDGLCRILGGRNRLLSGTPPTPPASVPGFTVLTASMSRESVVSRETHLCGPVARAIAAAHWPVRTLLLGSWLEPPAGGSAAR